MTKMSIDHPEQTVAQHQRRDEDAILTYLDWQELYTVEKPFQLFSAIADPKLLGHPTTNLIFKDGDVERIHNVRGFESQFELDTHGFAFCSHYLPAHNFDDPQWIEQTYLKEMENVLLREVGYVDQAYFFDWRIRKNIHVGGRTVIDANDKMQNWLPARHAHIDQTPSAVVGRVQLHLPEEANFLLQGRVRVIKQVASLSSGEDSESE